MSVTLGKSEFWVKTMIYSAKHTVYRRKRGDHGGVKNNRSTSGVLHGKREYNQANGCDHRSPSCGAHVVG